MTSPPLTYTLEGTTAVLHMDDGKANALSEAMIEVLGLAIARAEKEAAACVLVGRPDRFCGGFDLKIMMQSPQAATDLLRKGADLLMKLYGARLPLVIAATGHALAGGALVVLTGDVRVAAEGAYKIGLNEVSIGMPVPVLAMELARDRLAPAELLHATMESRIYDPTGAMFAGYVDEVVPKDRVLPRAMEEAARLSTLSKTAYVATKTRLRQRTIAHILGTLEEDFQTLIAG